MPDTMRGVYTNLTEIRRKVFREVARVCYEAGALEGHAALDFIDACFEELPYTILPGDVATYRESVFLERAVITERIRLAMGLPLQDLDRPTHVSEGLHGAAAAVRHYQPPLINIIKFACNACKDNVFEVTDACQGCLAHPCREICPKGAISFVNKRAYIDHDQQCL